jgi:sulfur relay (sulfurtransferase) complex TusBCD TusD component (DsrE family)
MEQDKDFAYYLQLINKAQSYQDLVFLRNRVFDAIDATLPVKDAEKLKQAWTERAKDESVPVVPAGQKRSAAG